MDRVPPTGTEEPPALPGAATESDADRSVVAAWVKPGASVPLQSVRHIPSVSSLAEDAWAWVDVTAATAGVAVAFGERFGLSELVVEDIIDVGIFPKWDDLDDVLLAVFHLPVTTGQRVDTMAMVCVVGARFLLTFHAEPHSGLEWFLDAACRHSPLAEGGPDRMLARLAELAAREFHPLVEGCDTASDALADRALQGDTAVLGDTQALRRDAALMRSVLGPQREAILTLAAAASGLLTEPSRSRLRDAYDHHHRLVEELDAARLLLASVVDTYRGAVAERTNDVMKVLTVFSATLLPLSVIAGVYGMNFTHMPELDERWAYPAALGVMALVASSLWIYFVRRGFVAGLGASRLPRTVGRGVLHAAGAPLRTVGSLVLRSGAGAPVGLGRTHRDLDQETAEVVAGLFSLGWQTPQTILQPEDGPPPS